MHSRIARAALAALLLAPFGASAQLAGGPSADTSAFSFSVTPRYPAPLSQATLSLLSSSLDLANARMTVTIAGKKIYEGNVQPVAIPLGKAGSVTAVSVTVSSNGATYSQPLRLQPQDVALVAEPAASAPPLYPGKPLVPLEGTTRMVAVATMRSADGKAMDPSALSYTWTVDDTTLANASGIGKNTLTVVSPLKYRQRTVSVRVQSQDGNLAGGADLTLSPAEPLVRIYKNDPLLGIRFDHALAGTYVLAGSEDTLYAAPFSLPIHTGAPLLQWFLNGAAAQTGNSITLRPSGSGAGSASLSLLASTNTNTTASMELPISFAAASGGSFFGL